MALLEYRLGTSGAFKPLPTPAPENYSPTYTHLENSYVSSNGYFIRDIVRKNRAKVTCGWKALTGEEMALLQSLYEQKSFSGVGAVCPFVYDGPDCQRPVVVRHQRRVGLHLYHTVQCGTH